MDRPNLNRSLEEDWESEGSSTPRAPPLVSSRTPARSHPQAPTQDQAQPDHSAETNDSAIGLNASGADGEETKPYLSFTPPTSSTGPALPTSEEVVRSRSHQQNDDVQARLEAVERECESLRGRMSRFDQHLDQVNRREEQAEEREQQRRQREREILAERFVVDEDNRYLTFLRAPMGLPVAPLHLVAPNSPASPRRPANRQWSDIVQQQVREVSTADRIRNIEARLSLLRSGRVSQSSVSSNSTPCPGLEERHPYSPPANWFHVQRGRSPRNPPSRRFPSARRFPSP